MQIRTNRQSEIVYNNIYKYHCLLNSNRFTLHTYVVDDETRFPLTLHHNRLYIVGNITETTYIVTFENSLLYNLVYNIRIRTVFMLRISQNHPLLTIYTKSRIRCLSIIIFSCLPNDILVTSDTYIHTQLYSSYILYSLNSIFLLTTK